MKMLMIILWYLCSRQYLNFVVFLTDFLSCDSYQLTDIVTIGVGKHFYPEPTQHMTQMFHFRIKMGLLQFIKDMF